jgi:hypothetical protein
VSLFLNFCGNPKAKKGQENSEKNQHQFGCRKRHAKRHGLSPRLSFYHAIADECNYPSKHD